jgi:hypothetical protein
MAVKSCPAVKLSQSRFAVVFITQFIKRIHGRTQMIRKHSSLVALAPLAVAVLPLLALPALAQNPAPAAPVMKTAAPTPSVAVGPPAVIAEPSPPANMAFEAMRGVVVSRPGASAARISLGSRNTLRVGARIEYLRNGLQFATGRVNSLNFADAVATVEPEAAEHYVGINTDIRVLENPAYNLGPTEDEIQEKEWRRFERDFVISAVIATGLYYAFK